MLGRMSAFEFPQQIVAREKKAMNSPVRMLKAIIAVAPLLIFSGWIQPTQAATPQEGVAVMIVYDNSGSMQQSVRDVSGHMAPKRVIANRALEAVVKDLQAFAASPEGARRPLQVGLLTFAGTGANVVVPLRPFDPVPFKKWLREEHKLQPGTPLGITVQAAGKAVLASPFQRKHVLVITDGVNTKGPDPVATLPGLREAADQQQTSVSFHFVAFDVDARVFDGVKKLGATVVGAADEPQLSTQIHFILEKKILLEDEEPQPKSN